MTDKALDLLARRVLLDALRSEWEHGNETTVLFMPSKKYQQQMRDMLADPQGWCKRKFRPMWKIALRRVAAFFLTALVGVSAWLAVDTQAREAFFGWAKEVCETFFVYHYEGPIVETVPTRYSPSWIPEKYHEVFSDLSDGEGIVVYSDEAGRYLQFSYVTNPNNSNVFLGVENTTRYEVLINGNCADFFSSTDPDISSGVAWVDTSNHLFCITGFLSEDELIKIAENVETINITEDDVEE